MSLLIPSSPTWEEGRRLVADKEVVEMVFPKISDERMEELKKIPVERISFDKSLPGYYTFEAKTTLELPEDQIRCLQYRAGYHPAGYGGPFDIKKVENGYQWKCFNTCE
jgi:hypothetical protein